MTKRLQSTPQTQPGTPHIPRTPFAYIWHVTKPFKWWAISGALVIIIASAASQGTSYFLKLIVDAVEAGNPSHVLWYALAYPVTVFVVQLLFRLSAFLIKQWVIDARKLGYDQLTAYIARHSNAYFSDRFAGSIMSKVGNIVEATDDVSVTTMWTHLTAFVSFLVTFAFIVRIDLWAGLTFIALIVVLIAVNRFFAPKKAALAKYNSEMKTRARGVMVDMFSNIQAVRQYARFAQEARDLDQVTTEMTQANHRNWGYTERMLFWNTLILFVFSLIMFWFLVEEWRLGTMGTGDFVLIISLYAQITGTLIFIGRAVESTARSIGEIQEGLEDVVIDHEVVDAPDAAVLQVTAGAIEWQAVSFTYGLNTVFRDFSLTIPAGQRVGLVGASGAGKSTFVSLLLRQHDLTGGRILIDRQDIAQVTQDSLREQIAVVPQEPLLFHRSIRENIAYGKPDATEAEIIAAATKAQAHTFITDLPNGYDTLVGERGVKLSGGQRQRVAIARALLKDAPILVLDEATSALDSESEVAIQQALETLMEGRTVIAVAHRLSTLREMDRLLVLAAGRIVEDGTHTELAAQGGVYHRLWSHQAGGFLME
ncbi:MAG: ABC transporter ATP-binding protein [Patescibacteria group bacterium]